MYARGFTLLELLISLTILTLLMTIGLPSFSAQIKNNRLKTTTMHLLESVEFTRNQAVTANTRAVIKHQGKWEDGWEVFIDSNDNGIRDEDENALTMSEKTKDVRITPNQPLKNYISFIGTGESRFIGKANGGAFQAGTIKICSDTNTNGYELILARSGRMRMNEIDSIACEAN